MISPPTSAMATAVFGIPWVSEHQCISTGSPTGPPIATKTATEQPNKHVRICRSQSMQLTDPHLVAPAHVAHCKIRLQKTGRIKLSIANAPGASAAVESPPAKAVEPDPSTATGASSGKSCEHVIVGFASPVGNRSRTNRLDRKNAARQPRSCYRCRAMSAANCCRCTCA